ncbi:MAG: bile acid:sodium symporter family protein [Bacteroidota bacterium]
MDKRNRTLIQRRIILIITFFFTAFLIFAGSFSSLARKNKITTALQQIPPGSPKSEVIEKIGEPGRIVEVHRWIYEPWGQVVIKNEKVLDIRLSGKWEDASPLYGDHQAMGTNQNALRYLRIGNSEEHVLEIAGKPGKIVKGEDWYYRNNKNLVEINEDKFVQGSVLQGKRLENLDWVRLNFSKSSLHILNITLAFIMFGVALEIRFDNFKKIFKDPKILVLGVISQFLALPLLTFVLVYFLNPPPSIALGMLLVAACPGGNISNFMSSLAKGNIALSISWTAIATLFAVFMTPLNFTFWGKLYSETSQMVIPISIDFFEVLRTVLILLGIPVVAGILFAKRFPGITAKIVKPLKGLSMIIFLVFVVMALANNFEFFRTYIHLIGFIVIAHNALALLTGFSIATLGGATRKDRRSMTIETGIQNSGLALVLIFNPRLFDGLGGMAFIAAWWGIWHILSGMTVAYLWSKKTLPEDQMIKQEANI